MKKQYLQKGQSVIELLVALSVFTIGIASIIFLTMDANTASFRSLLNTQAIALAEEGIEASRSIADGTFANLVDGMHGLSLSNNMWVFSNTSDTQDGFTRTVTISQPGLSSNLKKITSTVSFYTSPSKTRSVELVGYISRWNHPPLTEIECFSVDLSGASIEQGSVNKIVRYIWISNPSCNHEISIDKIVVTWNKPGSKLTKVRIDNFFLWQGSATSGTILDLEPNEELLPGALAKEIDQLHWDKSILGTDIGVKFIMSDGSFENFTIPAFN